MSTLDPVQHYECVNQNELLFDFAMKYCHWLLLFWMIKVMHFSASIHLCYSDTQALVPIDQLAAHQCSGIAGSGGWKCPCCDVVSPTATAAQRHMDSHSGVKAFRCTICRYKGNTLRGMRTHIRMHFEKRSTDLQVCVRTQYENIRLYSIVSKFMNPSVQDFSLP